MIIEGLLVTVVVLFGLLFVAGGVLWIGGVGGQLFERWRAFATALGSRHWVETTGRITRSVVTYTTTRRARVYAPAVRYTYSVGGETFSSVRFAFVAPNGGGGDGSEAGARAVVERFPVGTELRVFYDPKSPKRATVDRNVPPLVAFTLGWLATLPPVGGLMLALGVHIVRGPFEDPPKLGELPSLTAQVGGLAVALGVLFLLVAGARAAGGRERRQRKLLGLVESARSALVHEVRAAEPVVVCGRAEAMESEDETTVELPFEDGPLVYYDADVEWFRRTCFSVFGVRDASGVVLVELQETESTLLRQRTLRIEGEVERWLDEQRDDKSDPISAESQSLRIERIRKGDPVLVVGSPERENGDLVFRARPGDATSLLVADGSHDEIVLRLKKRIGRTRALFFAGAFLIVAGGVAAVTA